MEGNAGRPAPNRARTTGAALEAHYRLILWLAPTVERFPRNRKFPLGDRIQVTFTDGLERLIGATCSKPIRVSMGFAFCRGCPMTFGSPIDIRTNSPAGVSAILKAQGMDRPGLQQYAGVVNTDWSES